MLTASISPTGNKIYCTKVAGRPGMVYNDAGYFYRPLASRYEGTANFNNPGQTAVLKKYFMEVWEQSQADEEMRRLQL